MSLLEISVRNVDAVVGAFQGAPSVIEEELSDAIDGVLGQMTRALAEYPPPPSDRYVRTGTLRDGWLSQDTRYRMQGGAISAVIANPTPYGMWVQDADTQAWMHAGRWTNTVQAVEQQYAAAMQDAAQGALDAAAARINEVTA